MIHSEVPSLEFGEERIDYIAALLQGFPLSWQVSGHVTVLR